MDVFGLSYSGWAAFDVSRLGNLGYCFQWVLYSSHHIKQLRPLRLQTQ